jgi:hypothetical protein
MELENEKKASAGKDKKITELSSRTRDLQQKTMSQEELYALRQKELEEEKLEWQKQRDQERLELEELRIKQLRTDTLKKLKNFPIEFEDRIHGKTAEEIETDARNFVSKWLGDKTLRDNRDKVSGPPRSGDGKQISVSAEDVRNMSPQEKIKWSANASEEEYAAVFDELHS